MLFSDFGFSGSTVTRQIGRIYRIRNIWRRGLASPSSHTFVLSQSGQGAASGGKIGSSGFNERV